LLERFSKNVWFICTTYHISKLESPLQSRFFSIRIPSPSEIQIHHIINYLDNTCTAPVENRYTERNLIKAITMPVTINEKNQWIYSLTYPPLNDFILTTSEFSIENIRSIVYKAFQADVSLCEFAYDIIKICSQRGDNVHDMIKEFANYEHKASQSKGTRIIIYMEYMLYYAMTNTRKKRNIHHE
jgi:DNA polymerase III delta prime subunit